MLPALTRRCRLGGRVPRSPGWCRQVRRWRRVGGFGGRKPPAAEPRPARCRRSQSRIVELGLIFDSTDSHRVTAPFLLRAGVAWLWVCAAGRRTNVIRRLGVLVVVVVAAGVPAAGTILAQDSGVPDDGASTVRIQARLLDSGKVEFGLQLDGDRVWLPQARLFPYQTAEVGRWLFASPYTLSDGTTVRIQARRVASGKVEFGLQLDGDRVWLPQARLFPYQTAEVGRWLFASPFAVSDFEVRTVTVIRVYANAEFELEWFRIGAMALECLFVSHKGICAIPHDEVSTEDVVQATNALYGCNFDFANDRCHGMTTEEFQELVDKLACPEGYAFVKDGWFCDPKE